uniref:Transthyretin-like family protein n=1 Tax=Steinernema glaseri TaxID=37863 RepID=A0A1I7ZQS0_9BILA
MLLSALLVLTLCGTVVPFGNIQSAGIRGRLTCFGKPAAGVRVELYDDDGGYGNFFDDLLASGETDAEGHFSLQGHTSEFTTIDPLFIIVNKCNPRFLQRQRLYRVMLPDEYVYHGKEPMTFYEFGTMELSGRNVEPPVPISDCKDRS